MSAPIILRSDDPGAPTMATNYPFPIYTIMKWALPQLGWELVFDEPAIGGAVFRNADGKHLKLQHPSDTVSNRWWVRCQLFDTMTDYNTGVGATPPDLLSGQAMSIIMSNNAGGSPSSQERPYMFIGNSKAFYLRAGNSVPETPSETAGTMWFCGSLVPTDGLPAAFLMVGGGTTTTSAQSNATWGGDSQTISATSPIRALNDIFGSFDAAATVRWSLMGSDSNFYRAGQCLPFPNPVLGGITYAPVYAYVRVAAWGGTNGMLAGRFPGLYAVAEKVGPEFYASQIIGPYETLDGLVNFMVVPTANNIGASMPDPPAVMGSAPTAIFLMNITNGWDY